MQLYTRYLHLDIDQERFEGEDSVNSVRAFEQLPEVQAFKQSVGTTKYTYLLELLVYLPEHLEHASVTEGSYEGVMKLAQYQGDGLGYCTARIGNTASWDRDLQEATRLWLQHHQFPHAENTLFCAGPRAKLHAIAARLAIDPQPVLLIDDLYDRLVEHFSALEIKEQRLLSQYLVLGAYGATRASAGQQAPIHLIPLHSWKDMDMFLIMLDEHLMRQYGKEISYG